MYVYTHRVIKTWFGGTNFIAIICSFILVCTEMPFIQGEKNPPWIPNYIQWLFAPLSARVNYFLSVAVTEPQKIPRTKTEPRACSTYMINPAPGLRASISLKEQDVCNEIKAHFGF